MLFFYIKNNILIGHFQPLICNKREEEEESILEKGKGYSVMVTRLFWV